MDQSQKEEVQLIQVCAECGKRIAPSSGSMTAWLFRESRCSCLRPGAAEAAESSQLTASRVDELTAVVSDAQDSKGLEFQYRLIEMVGKGGMGEVYRAHDLQSSQDVAVKFLHPHLVSDSKAVLRFNNEAAANMGLEHAGLVKVRNFGRSTADNSPCIVMDFLEGESLDKALAVQGTMTIEKGTSLFLQLCDALSYLHSKLIVHRDLKPSNIILQSTDAGNNAVIVDFGIAKISEGQNLEQIQFTTTGEIVGSPPYMSPEQCTGQHLDSRSDVYSLGCVMYHVVSGKPPFEGTNPVQVIVKHLHEPAPRLSKIAQVPEKLSEVIHRCLEKDPADRYQSIDEISSDLRCFLEGKPLSKKKFSLAKSIARQKTKLLSVVSIALIASAAFVALNQMPQGNYETRWLALDKKGQACFDRGQLAESKRLFQESLGLADSSGDRTLKLASMNELMDIDIALSHSEESAKRKDQILQLENDSYVDGLKKEILLQSKQIQAPFDEETKSRVRRLCGEVNDVAASLNEFGDSEAADVIVRLVLDLGKRVLGESDPATIRSIVSLAKITHDRGDYKGAIESYEKSLALQRKIAPDTSLMAKTLMFLGRAYMQTDVPLADCEKLLEESLELNRKHFGPSSPEVAWSRYQLAALYAHFQRFSDALSELKAAIAIYERTKQTAHKDVSHLASCYSLMGWLTRDIELCKKALVTFESEKQKDYAALCQTLQHCAALMVNTNPQQALNYLSRAEVISNRFADYEKESLRFGFSKIKAFAYRKLGNARFSQMFYEDASRRASELFGKDSEQLLELTLARASYYNELGEFDVALRLYRNAIDAALASGKKDLVNSELVFDLYKEYLKVLKAQNKSKEAKEITEKWQQFGGKVKYY